MADHPNGSSHRNGKDKKKKKRFGLIEALSKKAGKDNKGQERFGSKFQAFFGSNEKKKKNNKSS